MKRNLLMLTGLIMFIAIILIIRISRIFTYDSTLSVLISFNPIHLIVINAGIFLSGIALIVFSSKMGIWWYQTYYSAINGLNRKASSKLGFEVEDVFAQESVIRKFARPYLVVWMLRTFGLVFSSVSAYYLYGILSA